MDKKGTLYYLSWIIATAIYSIIPLTIAFYLVKVEQKAKLYTSKAETVFSVELTEVAKVEEKLVVKKVEEKPRIEEKKVVKEDGSQSLKEKTNFKSLFENLNTEAKETSDKEREEVKQKTEVASRKFGQNKENPTQNNNLSEMFKKLEKVEKAVDRSAGEYNKYYAEVKTLLTSQFASYIQTKSESSAVAVIIIDNLGNFDYRITKLSNVSEFNVQLREFLEMMRTRKFPPYTEKSETQIEIEFKTEE